MKSRWGRFNIYLFLVLALLVGAGCRSPEGKKKKEVAIVRLHLEGRADVPDSTQSVPVYRARPVMINVIRAPILSEENVKEATVKDSVGGYQLELLMDRRGRWALEQYTAGNVGKRIAIFAAWGGQQNKNPQNARWLAAPRINHRIGDGVLAFTPDATREEAEAIALGLNNAAKKLQDAIE